MDKFLNQSLADALCATIFVGASTKDITEFQYSDLGEKTDYISVKNFLQDQGVSIAVSQSVSKSDLAYIVAKTPKVATLDAAYQFTDEYSKYLAVIEQKANLLSSPPYGAYIGGMSTTSKLFMVGPSALEQYSSVYRTEVDASISDAYKNGVVNTNNAINAVKEAQKNTVITQGMSIDYTDFSAAVTAPYIDGSLFKSYHGMIQSMIKYSTTIDTNSFIFEIALGNNTNKVSSCFPCSAFMTAQNRAATSTHLGRGDNWNIPSTCSIQFKSDWQKKINEWYNAGKLVLTKKNPSKFDTLFKALAINGRSNNIPDIFLEALTYESKFTSKIINSFN
jgi:hypothetical protein